MRIHSGYMVAVGLVAAFLVGCDKLGLSAPKPAVVKKSAAVKVTGTVVARVNNTAITLEDLNQEVEAVNAMAPENRPELKITTREGKLDYLKNEIVRRAIFYQEALDRGLDAQEDVVRALEKTKMDLLVMQLLKEEAGKVEVTSKEVEDYYNTYKEQLKEPEERQIREIVVTTEPEARDILIQLLQGTDFATLAKERSKAPSAKDGGDLGFIKRGDRPPQFEEVAFSDTLEAGKVSNIIKGPDGYYIIKLEGKRGGKQKTLSELWDDIKRALTFLKQQQRIEALYSKLSKDAKMKIEVFEGEVR